MTQTLNGRQVAFLATDGVEAIELSRPWGAVEAAGAVPNLISIDAGRIQGFDHLTPSTTFDVDLTAAAAEALEFDALVLPGGVANPDRLRTEDTVIDFVRAMIEKGHRRE